MASTSKRKEFQQVRVVTGKELVARSIVRPSLGGIEPRLFPNGLQRSVVEILGPTSSGKTTLLMHILARTLLPPNLGGCGAGAILLNTDQHFNIFRLAEIIEAQARSFSVDKGQVTSTTVKDCLRGLLVLNCYDSCSLEASVASLDYLLMEQVTVPLVVVDSLLSFYWADRIGKRLQSWEVYKKRWVTKLQKALQHHAVSLVYTQHREQHEAEEEEMTGSGFVRVRLRREGRTFQASVTSTALKLSKPFTVSGQGIAWGS